MVKTVISSPGVIGADLYKIYYVDSTKGSGYTELASITVADSMSSSISYELTQEKQRTLSSGTKFYIKAFDTTGRLEESNYSEAKVSFLKPVNLTLSASPADADTTLEVEGLGSKNGVAAIELLPETKVTCSADKAGYYPEEENVTLSTDKNIVLSLITPADAEATLSTQLGENFLLPVNVILNKIPYRKASTGALGFEDNSFYNIYVYQISFSDDQAAGLTKEIKYILPEDTYEQFPQSSSEKSYINNFFVKNGSTILELNHSEGNYSTKIEYDTVAANVDYELYIAFPKKYVSGEGKKIFLNTAAGEVELAIVNADDTSATIDSSKTQLFYKVNDGSINTTPLSVNSALFGGERVSYYAKGKEFLRGIDGSYTQILGKTASRKLPLKPCKGNNLPLSITEKQGYRLSLSGTLLTEVEDAEYKIAYITAAGTSLATYYAEIESAWYLSLPVKRSQSQNALAAKIHSAQIADTSKEALAVCDIFGNINNIAQHFNPDGTLDFYLVSNGVFCCEVSTFGWTWNSYTNDLNDVFALAVSLPKDEIITGYEEVIGFDENGNASGGEVESDHTHTFTGYLKDAISVEGGTVEREWGQCTQCGVIEIIDENFIPAT